MKIISNTYRITTFVIALSFTLSAVNPLGLMEWCKEMMIMHASVEMHHEMAEAETAHGDCEKTATTSDEPQENSTENCHDLKECLCFDEQSIKVYEPKLIKKAESAKVILAFYEFIQHTPVTIKLDRYRDLFLRPSYSPSDLNILNQSFLI